MGGYQVPGQGTGDDGYDEEGYDESQRAEILEATRDGPTDGTLITDLKPDLGDDPERRRSRNAIATRSASRTTMPIRTRTTSTRTRCRPAWTTTISTTTN